ncbi:MAG: glycosyltransferase family 2 protein [Nitrospirae bacterium]|nr:glycosyltransferase family 2 protein [Nitrospirota bacterium]
MTDEVSAQGGRRPMQRQTVHVVLPAYNEESRIGALLDRIDMAMWEEGFSYRVIVIDDGSRDATAAIVRDHGSHMPILLKRHETNQGLGAALRDGLIIAMESAAERDIIVTMDADDTHTPGLIVHMVRMIREGCDVVIASRYQPQSQTYGVPVTRRFFSYAGSLLCRWVLPIQGVRDFTSGFRAYRADVLSRAVQQYGGDFLDQDGFQCMVDILFKLRRLRLIFGEVPMILRYDLKQGASKMNIMKTARETLMLLFKRRFGT